MKRHRLLILAGVVMAVIGFLAFRPDKLFADDPIDETLSAAFTTTIAASPIQPDTSITSVTNSAPATPPTTEATPSTVTTGMFTGVGHSAVGTVTVYEENGQYVLRFEDDTDIQNGPDIYVWVLEGASYEDGTPSSYLDLGKLKGNIGGQNYLLPAEFDPAIHQSVLIWCLRFAVPFAHAPLA